MISPVRARLDNSCFTTYVRWFRNLIDAIWKSVKGFFQSPPPPPAKPAPSNFTALDQKMSELRKRIEGQLHVLERAKVHPALQPAAEGLIEELKKTPKLIGELQTELLLWRFDRLAGKS